MKKIGIMSMQRIINYGSFLQAYGLKKTLEKLGNNVEFIDYKFEKSIVDDKKDKNILKKIKNNLNVIEFLNKKKIVKEFRNEYNNNYLKMLNIQKDKYNYSTDIDTLVIGSDEVFNCLQPYPVGYSRGLFGYGYSEKNVISYAASFGFTTLEGLKKYNIDNEVAGLLKQFKAISVRDENSYEIVNKLINEKTTINFDPVLISDFTEEIKDIRIDKKDYIIVYAYTGRLSREEEKYIKNFAKKYNKKIISLGFYQRIADENLIVNPFEVLGYFKNADYVITDTFHGTIFSVKMNTKFCTIIRKSNYNKLSYLLNKLRQKNRMVNDLNDIEELYKKDINFDESNEVIKEEKEKSLNYLKTNI